MKHQAVQSSRHRISKIAARARCFAHAWLFASVLTGVACAEADKKRWDEFFGAKDGAVSPMGWRSGDTEVWTIECNEYRGASRREIADNMATALKRVDQIAGREIWVNHENDRSLVYCGEYKLKYVAPKSTGASGAPAEPQIQLNDAIRRDLEFVRGLALGDKYPFFSARPLPKPLPDVGPSEWDLRNAKGAYTLNVGVTYNTATLHNYKEAAIEWVRDLRQRGYQAYFYHDPVKPRSSICLGTFGDDAVAPMPDGRRQLSAAVQELRNKEEEFRYNLENGAKTFRSATGADGKRVRMPNESFLARIPRKEDIPTRSAGQS